MTVQFSKGVVLAILHIFNRELSRGFRWEGPETHILFSAEGGAKFEVSHSIVTDQTYEKNALKNALM